VQKPKYKGEMKISAFPGADKPMSDADLNDPVKRGLYLVALGHCVVCHSRQTPAGMDYVNGLGRRPEIRLATKRFFWELKPKKHTSV
jgi:hypothetical protein